MLFGFFLTLRAAGLKPGLGEFLALLEALRRHVIMFSLDDFYVLARTILVKDESQFDRYDRAFAAYFKGVDKVFEGFDKAIPEDWLRLEAMKLLSEEERAKIEAMGGWDKLMETLKQRLEEQKERHQGGNKWIGTGGTSPFGNGGYNPEGVRIGGEGGQKKAVKVWEKREYRNLDDSVELGTRNIKVALRKLRRFAREGAPDILDLDGTIEGTARNAGWLDLKMMPERHNAVKILLFLDVGGSMDWHVEAAEQLFSAARSQFKRLDHFYFHNCLYDTVWKDSRRRHVEQTPVMEVLRTYDAGHKIVLVGDASMSPYEIEKEGGSVERWNDESGEVWLRRLFGAYPRAVWLNPVPEKYWNGTASIGMIREITEDRMFPLTLHGIDRAMRRLKRRG